MTARRIAFAWVAALFVGLGLCVVAADPPKADPPADPLRPNDKDDALFAVAACSSCHSAEPGDAKAAQAHPFGKRYQSHQFVLLSEGKTWEKSDPHSQAFKALETDRGKKMGGRLGYDVTKAPQCLTCHAVDKLAGETLHPDALKEEAGKRFATAEGVACVGCHGVRKEWQTKHYEEPNTSPGKIPWREWDPEAKRGHGMRDLRDPAVKAKLCTSCHVGSAELGRVVTHDMYAAGHPPLPPFELATYLTAQPRHWEQPTKLPYFKAFKGDTWKQYHYHADENTAAREFAAGAVAAVRAEADMLAADARKGEGIDFARFDCLACHHDLKTPSDRQARGYAGAAPGRPPLRASVAVVAGVVVDHAKGLEAFKGVGEFAPKWDALRTAATRQPFGDDTVEGKAAAVRDWCDRFLSEQSRYDRPVYTKQQADNLRDAIAARVKGGVADPEAALVLAWGYTTIGGKELPAKLELREKNARADTPLGYRRRQEWVNGFTRDTFTEEFGKLK